MPLNSICKNQATNAVLKILSAMFCMANIFNKRTNKPPSQRFSILAATVGLLVPMPSPALPLYFWTFLFLSSAKEESSILPWVCFVCSQTCVCVCIWITVLGLSCKWDRCRKFVQRLCDIHKSCIANHSVHTLRAALYLTLTKLHKALIQQYKNS